MLFKGEIKMTSIPADKQPQVLIYDDIHPEDCAMLQALYSRSPAGVESHLAKVKKAGSGKFMSQYYVGYGHASIGDCGVTTIFMENYSMLAAKAIQDNPLYSGQEASTRYLDFSTQPMIDPYNNAASTAIQNGWMSLYNELMPKVIAALSNMYPYNDDYKSETIWKNAIEARAFDTLRGLLPVGTSTLLSWTTNLRQAREQLMRIKTHPLPEVREMAQELFEQMCEKYPNSFTGNEMELHSEHYSERDDYAVEYNTADHAQTWEEVVERYDLTKEEQMNVRQGDIIVRTNNIDIEAINRLEKEALENRPKGAALPRRLQSYGSYNLIFKLDFGSYRDLQRHRAGLCPLPLIDDSLGMHDWYLDELKILLGEEYHKVKARMDTLLDAIRNLREQGLETDAYRNQYLYPMGMAIPVTLTYHLPQMVYVSELRSGKPVHASLRPIAQQMALTLITKHPSIAMYADMDADSWTAKRGEQTIAEKVA